MGEKIEKFFTDFQSKQIYMKTLLRIFFVVIVAVMSGSSYGQTLSLPGDGKDFYLGFILPSYNTVANANTGGFFGAYALISTYNDNHVTVSYFDKITGVETPGARYFIPARTGIPVQLSLQNMLMAESGDVAEYGACHISADRAVNVEFFSTGACAGGSYLAITTPGLGKKYVVASYNDNPGNGGLLGQYLGPSSLENSRGCFEIIAAYNNTQVTITPNATTMGGHKGVNSGSGSTGVAVPYTVMLKRGQCYLVKSGSISSDVDISGSVIESDKPVAVLGAHENAFLGGVSGRNSEGRDFMVEQMVPVDYWDTTGYVSIPLKDSQPADPNNYEGVGENYRVYAYDSVASQVQFFDQCVSGSQNMTVGKYQFPAQERSAVTCPVDFESTNGKKFSVMMYDRRNFASAAPYPAPSMMTIIPMSHWRTSYLWYVPSNKFETLQSYYVNIIAPAGDFDGQAGIMGSFNGNTIKPIKQVLALDAQFKIIPKHPELGGIRFKLYPGSYYATGPHPFMVYNYGFRALDANFDLGDFDGDDFFFSYALPVGMKFGNGQSHMRMSVVPSCTSWNVCLHDSTFGLPGQGIKSITLLDDPAGDFIKPGYVYRNTRLDDSLDPNNNREINFSGDDSDVCFKVLVNRPIDTAYAPLFIVDDQGNATLTELNYQPPQVGLSPDSGRYLRVPLARDTCSTFVFRNRAKTGGASIDVVSARLKLNNPNFKIPTIFPPLPVSLKPGDSVVITACFTARDTIIQKDTINLVTGCFAEPIDLIAQGGIPQILAGNRDFGNVLVDSTKCDTVSVRNVGTMPLTLTNKWRLSNTANFSFRDSALLPMVLNPGQVVYLTFCYTPHIGQIDSAIFYWGTNEVDPYKHSIKDSTILRGAGVRYGFVWDRVIEDITVNPYIVDDSVLIRVFLLNNALKGSGGPPAHVDSVFISGPDADEFYILENQLHPGKGTFGNFDLNAGDSLWVDVVFKPDLTKPDPLKYADRHADLVASGTSEKNQKIKFTATLEKNGVKQSGEALSLTVRPNPASGNSVIVSLPPLHEPKAILSMYDVLGREVYRKETAPGVSEVEIPIRNLIPGVYYVRCLSDRVILTQKFEIAK